jgi:hypothetical protein
MFIIIVLGHIVPPKFSWLKMSIRGFAKVMCAFLMVISHFFNYS